MYKEKVDCCIVGAGPHGLAVAKGLVDLGWKVVVIDREIEMESRRNTMLIQPGGLQVLKTLNTLDELDTRYNRVEGYDYYVEEDCIAKLRYGNIEDSPFSYALGIPYRKLQHSLLNKCKENKNFTLLQGVEVKTFLKDAYGKVTGLMLNKSNEKLLIESKLIVGADGTKSIIRRLANITTEKRAWNYQALTFLLPRPKGWPSVLSNYRASGNRYLGVAAYNKEELSVLWGIKSGTFDYIKSQGIEKFLSQIKKMEPRLENIDYFIKNWDDVQLRTFEGHIASKWVADGIILIGSSAHSLTTFGGQNMNQALYDAQEAIKVADEALRTDDTSVTLLRKYEEKRKGVVEGIANFQEAAAAPEKANDGNKQPQNLPKELIKNQLIGMFRSMALGPLANQDQPFNQNVNSYDFEDERLPKIYSYKFPYEAPLNWIWSKIPKNDPIMSEMGLYAWQYKVPVLDPVSARALMLLTKVSNAKRIFEFGSSIGYSTICFANAMGEDGIVYYTEKDNNRVTKAREFIEKAKLTNRVKIMEGDALESFDSTEGEFDIILCDIDKSLYPTVLEKSLPRLKKGGLFIADNIFWRGVCFLKDDIETDIMARSIYTMTEGMLDHPNLFSTIVPVGDGMAIGIKQ